MGSNLTLSFLLMDQMLTENEMEAEFWKMWTIYHDRLKSVGLPKGHIRITFDIPGTED